MAEVTKDRSEDRLRWIVEADEQELTRWPGWRKSQFERGGELLEKAIRGERELSPLERMGRALMSLGEPGRRRRRRELEEQIKADLDHGRD